MRALARSDPALALNLLKFLPARLEFALARVLLFIMCDKPGPVAATKLLRRCRLGQRRGQPAGGETGLTIVALGSSDKLSLGRHELVNIVPKLLGQTN